LTRPTEEIRRPALRPGPAILIRLATAGDLPVLIRNMRSVVNEQVYTWTERVGKEKRERLLATIRDQRSLSIVARVPGVKEIVGHLSLSLPGDVQKVRHVRDLSILVVDGYREQGVGTALMRYAVDWARKKEGVEKIHLGVFSTNSRALRVYQAIGFEIEGVLKRQYLIRGEYVDEIVMGLFVK
jgi:RimJ/RimL family protein N-acetyltransferase